MPWLFWDASALVKRYTAELGRDTVNALFHAVPPLTMATTPWGYLETYAILVRRLNGGIIDLPSFTAAVTALQTEVVHSGDFGLLPIGERAVFASVATVRVHNLTATDAAILTALLGHVRALPAGGSACVLVASDRRLLRAAHAEGLATLNPEAVPAADVPAFLARL